MPSCGKPACESAIQLRNNTSSFQWHFFLDVRKNHFFNLIHFVVHLLKNEKRGNSIPWDWNNCSVRFFVITDWFWSLEQGNSIYILVIADTEIGLFYAFLGFLFPFLCHIDFFIVIRSNDPFGWLGFTHVLRNFN